MNNRIVYPINRDYQIKLMHPQTSDPFYSQAKRQVAIASLTSGFRRWWMLRKIRKQRFAAGREDPADV